MLNKAKTAAIALTTLGFSQISLAAPVAIDTSALNQEGSDKLKLAIGTTRSVAKSAFKGVGNQSSSLPYVSLSYKRFYVEGVGLGLRLGKVKDVDFSLVASPRFYEVKESFNKTDLAGIDETKPTYFAGFSARTDFNGIGSSIQVLKDVGGESDGIEVLAGIDKAFVKNKLTLIPSLNLNWKDDKVVDHFYGVQANEQNLTLSRPSYEGKSSLSYQASLSAIYNVTERINLVGVAKQDFFGDEISDSPIVSEDGISAYAVGVTFKLL